EPAAEAARGVVGEGAQLPGELRQDVLGHVLGVGVLQLPPPAPAVDVPAVMLDELVPAGLVRRVLPQPRQQAAAGRGERGIYHDGYYPPGGGKSSAHYSKRLRRTQASDDSRAARRPGAAEPAGQPDPSRRRLGRKIVARR